MGVSRPLLDSALPVMIEAEREADMRSMGVVALGFIVAIGGLTTLPHAGAPSAEYASDRSLPRSPADRGSTARR
jgi:hypothetical protein